MLQAVRDHQLATLARAVGHPEWLTDERFATRMGWGEHLDAVVRPAIEAWAASKTKLEVCAELCGQGLAAGPCFGPEDVINDPHVASHDMISRVERPDSEEPLLIVGNPIKLSNTPDAPDLRWPTLGQHTDEILRKDLGLEGDELEALRADGVIRSGPTP